MKDEGKTRIAVIAAKFRVGGFAYWAMPEESSFGQRVTIEDIDGDPSEAGFTIKFNGTHIEPHFGGRWWVLPEEEWHRLTLDVKSEEDCAQLAAIENGRGTINDLIGRIRTAPDGEEPKFRLVQKRAGASEPMLGWTFNFDSILDTKRDAEDNVIAARIRVTHPLKAARELVVHDSKGWWLLPDYIENNAPKTHTEEGETVKQNEAFSVDVIRSSNPKVDIGTLSIQAAIDSLQRQLKYEEEPVTITEVIDGSPWDAAHAMSLVLKQQFGWASAEPTPGFFGPEPPQLIAVEVGIGKTINVPWGLFKLPGIDGKIGTGMVEKNGRMVFQLTATVRRKSEEAVKGIANGIRATLRTDSIYRGKALKMNFPPADPRKPQIPMPSFLDVSAESTLIFSGDVENAIRTNLFTPIERYAQLAALKIPFKRGILLAGKFGTGKTELAKAAARAATKAGITSCYTQHAKDLPSLLQFLAQYAPAMAFVEDIDRVTSGERDEQLDEILNAIDGIESKGSEILVVLTTNNVDKIHPGMIRPGRLDAVIEVKRPDAVAVEKLLALYARGKMAPDQNLSGIGKVLEGETPAIIREVVERSKLAALKITEPGEPILLTAAALEESARTMAMQIELLKRGEVVPVSPMEILGRSLGARIGESIVEVVESVT